LFAAIFCVVGCGLVAYVNGVVGLDSESNNLDVFGMGTCCFGCFYIQQATMFVFMGVLF